MAFSPIKILANAITAIKPAAQSTPNAQPPAENPLDQLKDIHLPDHINSFPTAPGWWLVVAVIVILILVFIYRHYQYKKSIRLLIPAKKELSQLRLLTKDEINAGSLAALSTLLKRICLIYFPSQQVASLNGKHWLEFLNQQNPLSNDLEQQVFFSEKDIALFSMAAYQQNPIINHHDWITLVNASEQCIESIIISAAKQKKSNPLTPLKTDKGIAV